MNTCFSIKSINFNSEETESGIILRTEYQNKFYRTLIPKSFIEYFIRDIENIQIRTEPEFEIQINNVKIVFNETQNELDKYFVLLHKYEKLESEFSQIENLLESKISMVKNELESKISILKSELNQKQITNQELENKFNNLKSELNQNNISKNWENKINYLESKLNQEQINNQELVGKISDLESKIIQGNKIILKLELDQKNNNQELEKKINTLESKLNQGHNINPELEKKINQEHNSNLELEKKINNLKSELITLREASVDSEYKIRKLENNSAQKLKLLEYEANSSKIQTNLDFGTYNWFSSVYCYATEDNYIYSRTTSGESFPVNYFRINPNIKNIEMYKTAKKIMIDSISGTKSGQYNLVLSENLDCYCTLNIFVNFQLNIIDKDGKQINIIPDLYMGKNNKNVYLWSLTRDFLLTHK